MSRTKLKEFILNNRKRLAEKIMAEQMQLIPELKAKYDPAMIEKIKNDTSDNLNYLAQALFIGEKNIFSNYYNWLSSVLIERGIEPEFLQDHLQAAKNVFKSELDEKDFKLVQDYLNQAEINLKKSNNNYKSFITEDNLLQKEAEAYLSLLLDMKREEAVKFILDLVDQGISIENIYLEIFQNVQYEIGRLWQLNKISIAQEHYATSVTQLAMSQLYPKIFTSFKKGKKVLTTCIGDELHELGIRMVADLMELNGWDTIHLGANTPAVEILKLIEEKEIDILAISITLPGQLEDCKTLINSVRQNEKFDKVKIMVGGRLFKQNNKLWQKIGADGFASSAEEAVKVADSIL